MNALRLLIAGATALSVAAQPVLAQEDWPTKPMKIVVPWPPGGIVDARIRLIGDRLSRALKQQVVVENRPGASGTLGAQAAARAAPDGYTLLAGTFVDQAVALSLFRSLPYDPSATSCRSQTSAGPVWCSS
jgi:tripartite-type tricarboxylate transporter receptor subunit TctC